MSEELNIYQKLAKIRKQVEIMKKDSKAYGYNYVKEDAILVKVTALMDKYDLSLMPGVVPNSMNVIPYSYKKTKVNKDKSGNPIVYEENVNEILVSADTTWTWVNNNNPIERIEVPWSMVGQQNDASQSFGSGLTYSSRYFLLKYFNVSTSDDDPDKLRGRQREALAAEEAAIANEIITAFDENVKQYLKDNKEKAADVKKFISKYVKDANYFDIKEPVLAAKLTEDFKKYFLKTE